MFLTVLHDFDLHELELVFLIGIITISFKVEPLGEIKLPCEIASCSITSTRWDAEGTPHVDRVERQFDSVWKEFVGDGSSTASYMLCISVGHSTVHGHIVACIIWVVSRV